MTDEARKLVEKLREHGCHGCIHKRYGDCKKIESGDYCDTISHDAAALMEELIEELEESQKRESGLSIMLTSAQSAAETWQRRAEAAERDINMCCPCKVCTRSCTYDKVNPYDECADFEWRGPCAENGGADHAE